MAEDGLVYSGIVANLAKCFCYPYQYFNLWLQKHKLHWSFDWTKQLQDKAHINCQYQLLGKYVEGEVCAEVLNFPGFSGCLDFKNSVKRTKRTSFSVVSCRTFVQNYENLPAVSKKREFSKGLLFHLPHFCHNEQKRPKITAEALVCKGFHCTFPISLAQLTGSAC